MKNSKGQSAMEYLMTYGWAILVVVAVVAALYGLGVFKVGSGTVKCSPCFSYFAFVDYSAGTAVLTNGPNEVNLTSATGGTVTVGLVQPGSTFQITSIAQTGNPAVTVTYTVTASSLSHQDTATIHN
ncbi:MAG TPA: hypothetical protein VJH34_03855 [archaeon]|nr:hypothetical protein [archaeon]